MVHESMRRARQSITITAIIVHVGSALSLTNQFPSCVGGNTGSSDRSEGVLDASPSACEETLGPHYNWISCSQTRDWLSRKDWSKELVRAEYSYLHACEL